MELYFSPMACSLATRIALYEAGAAATYLEIDPKTKVVRNDGSDFRKVNPLGLVPTLRTDDGIVLTENAAILQYVADRFPQAGLGTAQERDGYDVPGRAEAAEAQWGEHVYDPEGDARQGNQPYAGGELGIAQRRPHRPQALRLRRRWGRHELRALPARGQRGDRG